MEIVKVDRDMFLLDDRWYTPTDNHFLARRLLNRLSSSIAGPFVKPIESIDERFMEIINKDFIIVDVGATTGEYTLGASLYSKHVYSIEASPSKFKCLENNMRLHNITNVSALNFAISNTDDENIILYDVDDSIFGGSVHNNENINPDRKFNVTTLTLDSLVKKYDVEVAKSIDSCFHKIFNKHTKVVLMVNGKNN